MWFCLRAGLPVLFGFEYNNNTFKKQYKKINIYKYIYMNVLQTF